MKVTRKPLKDAFQTGRAMHLMVNNYYYDMAPWADLSALEIFEVISSLPFNPDPKGKELIKRPFYTMERIGPGGDCDDKSIAVASWAKLNGIPYKFGAVGRKKKFFGKIGLSHVYLEVYILGSWILFDSTYSFNVLGQNLGGYDRIEILPP